MKGYRGRGSLDRSLRAEPFAGLGAETPLPGVPPEIAQTRGRQGHSGSSQETVALYKHEHNQSSRTKIKGRPVASSSSSV